MAETPQHIAVSGKTFWGALDPRATDVAREEGWPQATSRRVGKGLQFRYPYSDDLAEKIASHLEVLAESFAYSDDPDTRVEGRSFARDAARIRQQMARTQR